MTIDQFLIAAIWGFIIGTIPIAVASFTNVSGIKWQHVIFFGLFAFTVALAVVV